MNSEESNRHQHWENIYKTKPLHESGWYQPIPFTSLDFIKSYAIPTHAKIIDIGGGDSLFADHLLEMGYLDITVLDISETAIARAKARLGDNAGKIKWIVADAVNFQPTEKYDFWHDRAAFHFLLEDTEIENYIHTAQQSIKPEGILIIGTFSENGPKKCSGVDIKQYSELTMTDRLKKFFTKVECLYVDHKTPSGGLQNYVFCSFRKRTNVSLEHNSPFQ